MTCEDIEPDETDLPHVTVTHMVEGAPSQNNICSLCGGLVPNGSGLCTFHTQGTEDGWAATNRIVCDYIHRQQPMSRLSVSEREENVDTGPTDPAVQAPY